MCDVGRSTFALIIVAWFTQNEIFVGIHLGIHLGMHRPRLAIRAHPLYQITTRKIWVKFEAAFQNCNLDIPHQSISVRAISSILRNNCDMKICYVIASKIFAKERRFGLIVHIKKFITLFLIIFRQGQRLTFSCRQEVLTSSICYHGYCAVRTYCFLSRPLIRESVMFGVL